MKVYVMGKFLEPEIREASNGQTFIRFSVYGNHQSMQFDVYEIQAVFVRGERQNVTNPLFEMLINLSEGTAVIATVRPIYNDKYKEIRYFLETLNVVDEPSQKVINSVLSSKNNKS